MKRKKSIPLSKSDDLEAIEKDLMEAINTLENVNKRVLEILEPLIPERTQEPIENTRSEKGTE